METYCDEVAGADVYPMHAHDQHELLWGATVRFAVQHAARVWVVPPMMGFWVPAGVIHGGFIAARGAYYSTFFAPDRSPARWDVPTPVCMAPAVRELILHARSREFEGPIGTRVEQLVLDLLEPIGVGSLTLAMPTDGRARMVADSLIANPADRRNIDAWSRAVGSSSRHLTRLFDVQTGMSFAEWRAHARIAAALADLAEGTDVNAVARRVGYRNVSAFARVFKRLTGHRPTEYFTATAPSTSRRELPRSPDP